MLSGTVPIETADQSGGNPWQTWAGGFFLVDFARGMEQDGTNNV
jgi:hypothetical protein